MNHPSPAIAVAGAGSVGCYIGGLLGRVAPVVLIGRERMREEIAAHDLHLSDLDGETLEIGADGVRFVTDMQAVAGADLVLVAVKSGDTARVAEAMAPAVKPGARVISFQNGLHNPQVLQERLPQATVLAGMVPFNVLHRGRGHFHRASGGRLMVAREGADEGLAGLFAAAGLPLQLRDDMPAVQWAKLLLNLNNAINALSDLPLRAELALRPYRRCLALVQREALRALRAAGIRPARLTPLPPRLLPALLELPDAAFKTLARQLLAIDPLARSSTWDDLGSGRRTEVEHINGEVVRLAGRHGLAAPGNVRLIELVRAAEAGDRRIWRGADLWATLREAAKQG